jgi:hypothetical protein
MVWGATIIVLFGLARAIVRWSNVYSEDGLSVMAALIVADSAFPALAIGVAIYLYNSWSPSTGAR